MGGGGTTLKDKEAELARQQAAEEVKKLQGAYQTLDTEATDKLLLQSQESLKSSYGAPPEGFIWSMSGEPISLGDKDKEPEDVVYTYLQALSKLNMDTAEFFSRGSDVVKSYKEFYSETFNVTGDYKLEFEREIYKQGMLSLEILGIDNTAVFAENKNTYTVKARIVDLSNKDFWKSEEEKFLGNLYYLDKNEGDSAKMDAAIYNAILTYYKSPGVKKRDISFDVTVQRYPDLDSGWLVSTDLTLDSELRYKDGNAVVNYINQQYQDFKVKKSLEEVQGRR